MITPSLEITIVTPNLCVQLICKLQATTIYCIAIFVKNIKISITAWLLTFHPDIEPKQTLLQRLIEYEAKFMLLAFWEIWKVKQRKQFHQLLPRKSERFCQIFILHLAQWNFVNVKVLKSFSGDKETKKNGNTDNIMCQNSGAVSLENITMFMFSWKVNRGLVQECIF